MKLIVLLVDDLDNDLIIERRYIEQLARKYALDVQVDFAHTVVEAIDRIMQDPRPLLVISDVRLMTGETGWDVKHACAHTTPPIPCYLVSGVGSQTPAHDPIIVKKRVFRQWVEGILLGWVVRSDVTVP